MKTTLNDLIGSIIKCGIHALTLIEASYFETFIH